MNYSYHEFCRLKILPIFRYYLVFWGDSFAASDILRRIKDEYLLKDLREFNFSRVTLSRGDSIDSLIAVAEELPLMAEKRLVHVLGAQELSPAGKKRLAAYLKDFPLTTVVVLGVEHPDDRHARDKERIHIGKEVDEVIRKDGVFINCSLSEGEAENWLRERFKSAGKDVKPEVVRLMWERVGDNLALLSSEFEKLNCYTLDRKEVRKKDVEAIVTRYPNAKIYELGNRLGTRNAPGALSVLEDLLREEGAIESAGKAKGPGLKILGYINSYYRTLNSILKYREKKIPAPEMARELKMHPFRLKKLLEESAGLDGRQLGLIFHLLHRADLGMKQGKDPRLILETTVIQICRGR